MVELIKSYRQEVPALRFIGMKYGDEDRVDGGFGKQWGEFFENGWFSALEGLAGGDPKGTCEDGDSYVGLMRWKEGEPFQYWIGMFLPAGTETPPELQSTGFRHADFPAASLGVCWLHGPESEVYMKEEQCAERLGADGMKIVPDTDGAYWFFERYQCPRFTTADENGNIILDICHYVE
ncbi:MAG: hypothetical protein FWF44_09885 [Defluviitaleaceae bacterium]|nr:hypothetical protein [Defluviitaleaceae bacterium]